MIEASVLYYVSRVNKMHVCTFQSWSDEAASDARRWSRRCLALTHDNTTGRWVDGFGSCGQNIFIATHKVPW